MTRIPLKFSVCYNQQEVEREIHPSGSEDDLSVKLARTHITLPWCWLVAVVAKSCLGLLSYENIPV